MIYEVRTYPAPAGPWPNLKSALPSGCPARETLQVRGLLAYRVRSAQSSHPRLSLRRPATADSRPRRARPRHRAAAAPRRGDLIVAQESEIMHPALFMHPLGSRDYGTGERV